MIYKVKLTHSVDVFVEAATEDDLMDWMNRTTPAEALEQSEQKAESSYSEEVLCMVNGYADIVLKSSYEKALTENIQYLSRYITVTEPIKKSILTHIEEYINNKKIIAYYIDKIDFYKDWKLMGYDKKDADALLKSKNEFMILPENAGIVRFQI